MRPARQTALRTTQGESAPRSCLPRRGRWQPPISREAAVGRGALSVSVAQVRPLRDRAEPSAARLARYYIFIVSAKRSLRNRLPREKCGGFAILANPPHYLSCAPSSRRAPFFFILHAAGFPAPHPRSGSPAPARSKAPSPFPPAPRGFPPWPFGACCSPDSGAPG